MPAKKNPTHPTGKKIAAVKHAEAKRMNIPAAISPESIAPMVHWLRHEKVMLDSDLAELYGVPTKVLNQAVKRNIGRFPQDFMFQITEVERDDLRSRIVILKGGDQNQDSQTVASKPASAGMNRSQIVTGSQKHRDPRNLPYAFTEQGVAMLSSVLRSERAVEVNIAIMRTFVQLRRLMDSNSDLARKIAEMEEKYDGQFQVVFDAIRQLIAPAAKPAREMGFHTLPQPGPAKKTSRRKP